MCAASLRAYSKVGHHGTSHGRLQHPREVNIHRIGVGHPEWPSSVSWVQINDGFVFAAPRMLACERGGSEETVFFSMADQENDIVCRLRLGFEHSGRLEDDGRAYSVVRSTRRSSY